MLRYFLPPPPVPKYSSKIYNFADYKAVYDTGIVTFDEELGWVNKPNARGYGMVGEYLSFDSMTFRENGNKMSIMNRPTILAIGDSYTLGVEVDNSDTWPSQLESKLLMKVLNGGVGGYGLDQMLIRTKSVLSKIKVDVVVVAFILEDINRIKQKKQYSIIKPYFTIKDNQLISAKVKIEDYPPTDYFKKIFGYSYVIHIIMSKIFKDYWSRGSLLDMEYLDINEVEIGNKIIDEFANIADANKVACVIFVLLPSCYGDLSLVNHPVTKYIKNLSRKNSRIHFIDIQTDIFNMATFNQVSDSELRAFFNDTTKGYHGHFSKKGNEFVAQEILLSRNSTGCFKK